MSRRPPDAAPRPARLGLVDWGIGGIGLLARLDEVVPGLPIVYWSDTGAVPYGLQRAPDLAARLLQVVAGLAEEGCTEVVLACNAASTVVGALGAAVVPVEGIIGHGIEAALAATTRSTSTSTAADGPGAAGAVDGADGADGDDGDHVVIGVVGGRRTIASGAYRRALAAPGRTVRSRVAQPLSAHIEAGRTGDPAFVADLHRIVAPLRGADAVVLACTHYPSAGRWFTEALPGSLVIDPAAHLADAVARRHPRPVWPERDRPGDRRFVTTGDPQAMRAAARFAWGVELEGIEARSA